MTIRAGRRLAAAAGLTAVLIVAGCTNAPSGGDTGAQSLENPDRVVLADSEPGTDHIDGDAADMALEASQAFFEKAPAVVVLGNEAEDPDEADDPDDAEDLDESGVGESSAKQARELGVPLLVSPDNAEGMQGFEAELKRLGARTLLVHGTLPDELVGDWEVVDGAGPEPEVPDIEPAQGGPESDFAVVADSGKEAAAQAGPALATAQAAGAERHTMRSADPRAAKNQEFFAGHADAALYAFGSGFGETEEFLALAATAAEGKQLPGGGQIVFPDRRMVALYGAPGTASLGLLGEQDVEGAIERVKEQAAQYQPYSEEKVQPAFEIIATVASAAPGAEGKYSSYTPVEQLQPWVEEAEKEGVYVVLDLQPGRSDFLTQAKHYEELLTYPNVGLAYDAEWRLKPGQRHMAQIGSVDAAELNRTNDWLAELTRKNHLPQKVVIVHQFKLSMIEDRSTLDTSHPELAMVLHADGNGTPGLKMATWDALRRDLPEGIRMAWKNFIDEDSPTFTPQQTFDVDPKPWFVSYQ